MRSLTSSAGASPRLTPAHARSQREVAERGAKTDSAGGSVATGTSLAAPAGSAWHGTALLFAEPHMTNGTVIEERRRLRHSSERRWFYDRTDGAVSEGLDVHPILGNRTPRGVLANRRRVFRDPRFHVQTRRDTCRTAQGGCSDTTMYISLTPAWTTLSDDLAGSAARHPGRAHPRGVGL